MDGSIYVNRESGALVKIGPVGEGYAQQVVLTGPAAGGSYKIPIADYDRVFVEQFRPAGQDDLIALEPDSRPPRNATPEWLEEGSPGSRTLASAIARIEARIAAETVPGKASAGPAYVEGLEDALAELRGA